MKTITIITATYEPVPDWKDWVEEPQPHGGYTDPVKIAKDLAKKWEKLSEAAASSPFMGQIKSLLVTKWCEGELSHQLITAEAPAYIFNLVKANQLHYVEYLDGRMSPASPLVWQFLYSDSIVVGADLTNALTVASSVFQRVGLLPPAWYLVHGATCILNPIRLLKLDNLPADKLLKVVDSYRTRQPAILSSKDFVESVQAQTPITEHMSLSYMLDHYVDYALARVLAETVDPGEIIA